MSDTQVPKLPSKGDRQRQLEQSVNQAMERYKREADAVRARSERLRALREAHEAHEAANPAPVAPRKPAKGQKAGA